jgi:pimeloyl-ACP methyl ester carboxylesterase
MTRVRLHVVEEGAGADAPPLVFVHGWCCNHGHFAPQREHFSRRHRVVSLDLRGHGQSEAPPPGPYTIEAFADDLVRLCDDLKLAAPVLVGHSMGARIVVTAAAHMRAAGVVLLDSTLRFLPRVAEDTAARVAAMLGPDGEAARRQMLEQVMFAPGDDAAVRARVLAEMAATPLRVAAPALMSLAEWDGVAAARRVQAPMLAIVARPLTLQSMLPLLPELPRLQLGLTVGSGHFLQLIVPAQVNAMIERFVATECAAGEVFRKRSDA